MSAQSAKRLKVQNKRLSYKKASAASCVETYSKTFFFSCNFGLLWTPNIVILILLNILQLPGLNL